MTKGDSKQDYDTVGIFQSDCEALWVSLTDISDCYPSNYTHAVAWALHGCEHAKKHRKINMLGNQLDRLIWSSREGQLKMCMWRRFIKMDNQCFRPLILIAFCLSAWHRRLALTIAIALLFALSAAVFPAPEVPKDFVVAFLTTEREMLASMACPHRAVRFDC